MSVPSHLFGNPARTLRYAIIEESDMEQAINLMEARRAQIGHNAPENGLVRATIHKLE